ncbi:WD40-repeat-containing domain protein, partial [Fomitopsis serialis]|uniref:WD40-repeat-containing domain protein n=1 Tax=Fomitopsis serialis TaxID=139415 RepID=UPI002007B657
RTTLIGHTGPVYAVCLRSDGQVLLTGGGDAKLMIWNVVTGELQQEICDVFHGAIGSVCWVDFEGRGDDGFAYGCSNGTIHVYKWSPIRGQYVFVSLTDAHRGRQVQDIRFNSKYRRIASIGDGSPCVWRIDDRGILSTMVKDAPRRAFMGRTVHFCDDGASILATFLETHEM